ncbi:MAG TPA: helicase HerA-like domain-containing protein [Cellulomonas sp.]|uniref:helicase HerA-like domain-containing protein n=1 Tax=Cellulomonas sp. TaxID=40001 RepID=UPI002E3611BE|nr:helicase HerA-like domain-containing protein [Cellulomonas sp.]HEX5331404.1 helicase HerA-like domain-containing protein [Cellulomonas sp.]
MSDAHSRSVPSVPGAAEIAALKAAAAQAAAEAAEARAAAAVAAAEAAQAAADAATDVPAVAAAASPAPPAASPSAAASSTPAAPPSQAPTAGPGPSEWAAKVTAGYTFAGEMLRLGALVEGDTPTTSAQVGLPLAMMNRHGLVAGATGTGKTKTLQVMTEALSAAGVPVFVADIKGDLSGLAQAGQPNDKLLARTASVGQDWHATAHPVEFYSLGGLGHGTPIRTTVTDFGPLLLSKVLGLNETQESSLGLIFHWADTQGLALLDLKDLQATIAYLIGDEGKASLKGIGGLSAATAGVILREIVTLQAQGADVFFGEPAFDVTELLRTASDGRGIISALELPSVQDRPALFSTFLMWLLADLFQVLPEVGDPVKPKLVFFFDEAHLLFTGASGDFLTQVTQTVRLIRSKGVGVFFVTQSPKDVPGDVLAQLGNRVQHALRAYTPDDAKALRAAASTFPNSPYDLEEVLTTLGTGEAIVTVLSEKGAPTPVAWTRLRAPQSSMDPLPEAALTAAVAASPVSARYATAIDRESAYELLAARTASAAAESAAAAAAEQQAKAADVAAKQAAKDAAARAKELDRISREMEREAASASRRTTTAQSRSRASSPLDSFLRSAGTQLGREITRSLFGTRRR